MSIINIVNVSDIKNISIISTLSNNYVNEIIQSTIDSNILFLANGIEGV